MNKFVILFSLVSSLALGQSLPLSGSGGVSLSTSQTITGAKTFSANLTVSSGFKLGVGGAATYPFQVQGAAAGGALFGLTGSALTTSDIMLYASGPTLTGSFDAAQFLGTVTADLHFLIKNQDSTSNTAHAKFELAVGGASGGDPKIVYTIPGVNNWALGIDNSDSDKFKLSLSDTLGSGDLFTVTTAGVFDTASTISSNTLKVPVVHGSGTAEQAMERGAAAMTGSELAVTFGTTFGAAPICVCTHVNTTNTNACNIKSGSAPTTTTVTFAVPTGGTDVVDWFCIGQR